MSDLVILGDACKVIKSATSRPVTLTRASSATGDEDMDEKGVAYVVPAGKELLITNVTLSSTIAAQFMHFRFREGAAGAIHWFIQLPKGNSQPEGFVHSFETADIWTAGTALNLNANQQEGTAIMKGVEYDV